MIVLSLINYNFLTSSESLIQNNRTLNIERLKRIIIFYTKMGKNNKRESSQSSPSSSSQHKKKSQKSNRKYSRITPEVKDKLIFLIVRTNMSIKNAAQFLKINYSSAKFIFNQYRCKNQRSDNTIKNENITYRIRKLQQGEQDGVDIKYTVGGKFEGECTRAYTADQICRMSQTSTEKKKQN